jgi:motility quorum-sensing regulator / GCU-specific mRNA interferase toxin
MIRCRSVEKRKPHFDLNTVRRLAKNPASRIITRQAFKDTALLGLEENDIVECVAQLTRQDFYKSMTVYTNAQLWQDVYHPTHQEEPLYVKVQLDATEETVVIVSCKAR